MRPFFLLAPNFVLAITKERNLLFLQATGKLSHLILHQGGQNLNAERIK